MKSKKNKRRRQNRKKSSQMPPVPLRQSIALLGFRGVGKTTIARKLAELRPARVVSLDTEIEQQLGTTIEEFVKREGWPAFRALELQKLREVAGLNEVLILDTGGGIVEDASGQLSQEKVDILKKAFFCIYLTMPDDLLLKRLAAAKKTGSRPALPGGEAGLGEVLARRKPFYQQLADAVVDISDVTAAEAAVRVAQLLRNR